MLLHDGDIQPHGAGCDAIFPDGRHVADRQVATSRQQAGRRWTANRSLPRVNAEFSYCFGHCETSWWSRRQESNLYLALRRHSFYPLNYGETLAEALLAGL